MTMKQDPKFPKFIKKLVNAQKREALIELLQDMDSVAIASVLIQLKLKHQLGVLEVLDNEKASEVLSYLHHSPVLQSIVECLKTRTLSSIVEEMSRDDAVDFLSVMEEDRADAVLNQLPRKDRQEIASLMQYDEESAGGIMDPHVVTVTKDQSVLDAVKFIRRYTEDTDVDDFYIIYVVDEHRHLIGKLKATQLLLARGNKQIEELMDPNVVAVDVDLDQEKVAKIAREYDLVVVPVIDKHLRLVGRVTIDDLVDVISSEYEEDIALIAGTGDEDVLDISILKSMRDRLPWLLLALAGGGLAAMVMSGFEQSLLKMPKVAYFVPLIAALGGNIGIQSASIVVRGLATGEIRSGDLVIRLWRELRLGFLNGIVCSIGLVLLTWLMTDDLSLGVSTGLALLMVVCIAAAIGGTVPIMLKRVNVDPALATGPFITTANDVLGVIIYLLVAFNFHRVWVIH